MELIISYIVENNNHSSKTANGLQKHEISTENTLIELRQEIFRLTEAMKHGFEIIDQRFEKVDQRFEKVDQRFEDMNKRIDDHMKFAEKRFEEMNKRFEDLQKYSEKRFEMMEKHMDRNFQRIQWSIGISLTIILAAMTAFRIFFPAG